mmetsp:Transcript_38113/g.84922  ORF Transcript_38113/g.84922 Transcript_38113/m.84922 type:complete len:251 (-) Transcript_38113:253-1005(-)
MQMRPASTPYMQTRPASTTSTLCMHKLLLPGCCCAGGQAPECRHCINHLLCRLHTLTLGRHKVVRPGSNSLGHRLRGDTGQEGSSHHCRQLHVVVVITQEGARVSGHSPLAHQVLGSFHLAAGSWVEVSRPEVEAAAEAQGGGAHHLTQLIQALAILGVDPEARGIAVGVQGPALLGQLLVPVPQQTLALVRMHDVLVGGSCRLLQRAPLIILRHRAGCGKYGPRVQNAAAILAYIGVSGWQEWQPHEEG